MGATCLKLEPPAGDPMGMYNPAASAALHEGVKVLTADLKTDEGQKVLQRELARTDVLLTSLRPSAFEKLGLGWKTVHSLNPALSHVAMVGALGEAPGHDLAYMADNDLVTGLDLPPTLYADMSGFLPHPDLWATGPAGSGSGYSAARDGGLRRGGRSD